MDERATTLVDSEKRWAPIVYATCAVFAVLGVALLGAALFLLAQSYGLESNPALLAIWLICCALWAAPVASNVHYLHHHSMPTVGMSAVALFSLAPAAVALLAALATDTPYSPGLTVFASVTAIATLVVSLAGIVFFFAGFARLRAAYAHAPLPTEDAVIIVLGGAVRDGVCCRTLVRRLRTAGALWVEAPTRILILTGGPAVTGPGTEADAMRAWLVGHGVHEGALVLEPRARNTAQNIQLSLSLIREHSLETRQTCVLSSDYHLYRALAEGRRQGVDLVPIPAPTPKASIPQQWSREVLTILYERAIH